MLSIFWVSDFSTVTKGGFFACRLWRIVGLFTTLYVGDTGVDLRGKLGVAESRISAGKASKVNSFLACGVILALLLDLF
jgi:hypothetical protein